MAEESKVVDAGEVIAETEQAETEELETETESERGIRHHHAPKGFGDRVALGFVKFLRIFADAFFSNRYGHRAVVLETVAAVPGMVGGNFMHLKSLRTMQSDYGWIRTLLDEAENERSHLMSFVELVKPTWIERVIVITAQVMFYVLYACIYLVSSRTAHRIVGYLEEEAVLSYTRYLKEIDEGRIDNVPAPDVAREYWDLDENARLRDLIIVIRNDEIRHKEVNHCLADKLSDNEYTMADLNEFTDDEIAQLNKYAERDVP